MPTNPADRRWRSTWRVVEQWAAWALVVACFAAVAIGCAGWTVASLPAWLGLAHEAAVGLWLPLGWFAACCAVVAGVRHLRWQAAGLAAAAAFVLVPELWRSPRPVAVSSAPGAKLCVASVNLCAENNDEVRMVQALRDLDADVLVLPEFTDAWERCLDAAFFEDYPHRWLASPPPREDYATDSLRLAIWSRIPGIGDAEVLQLGGMRSQLKVRLQWQGRVIPMFGIHPAKPFPARGYRMAAADWDRLADWIGEESGALIVAGDFNAVPRGRFLEQLTSVGLANAAEAVLGRAPGTWPANGIVPEPLRLAIDHVLYRAPLAASGFRVGLPSGSDHAGICATLVWLP